MTAGFLLPLPGHRERVTETSVDRLSSTKFSVVVDDVRRGRYGVDEAVEHLLTQLTVNERLTLLDGDVPLYRGIAATLLNGYNVRPLSAGAVGRLGMPGLRFTDGPRGVTVGHSTAFPAAIARAATWDPQLEMRVGRAIGAEARAQGANFFAGICVNLVRHPGWGRAQESYGEDPVLLGAMGAAAVRGASEHVMTCVKHFALNSIEESRFKVDVEVEAATLHEVYLPHFKAALDAGATAVMTAYNAVNGQWCGDSKALIGDVLREMWGFGGVVVTDFAWGMRDPVGSLLVGQDVEMPFRQQRARALPRALRDGTVTVADIDRSARRLLHAQVRYAASLGAPLDRMCVASSQHRQLAREVATRGAVLLRNEAIDDTPVLPIAGGPITVIGHLATSANLGDVGSSAVRPPSTMSVLDGLKEVLGAEPMTFVDGAARAAAVAAAADASTVVIVVGLSAIDEGEAFVATEPAALQLFGPPFSWRPAARLLSRLLRGLDRRRKVRGGDRRDLRLHRSDEAVIDAVAKVNPRTVVVLIGGSVIVTTSWAPKVAAILMAWYPGMEGGGAIADILLGTHEPGGRLPVAVPTTAAHLPHFDPDADHIVYDAWWGQRLLDRDGHPPAYPLGFGLGYTTFTLDDLRVDTSEQRANTARCQVTNVGDRDGSTVVQLYAINESEPTAIHRLVGFTRVTVARGQTITVVIPIADEPFSRFDLATGTWSRRSGRWILRAGQYAGDPQALTCALPSSAT